jgi:peroxiredoxin
MKLVEGSLAPLIEATTVVGARIAVPDPDSVVHLQFRRFAGCPICNLHVRAIARDIQRIRDAGVREIAMFHSTREALQPYVTDLPFDVVADPARTFYRAYGVERSARAVLDPRAWMSMARGLGIAPLAGALDPSEDHLGLPADVIVDRKGMIRSVHYGTHADDHWSVDEIIARAT